MANRLVNLLCGLAVCLTSVSSHAAVISIIIDDLGYSHHQGKSAVRRLPEAVTFAIIPDTPAALAVADMATANGHEIMLHLPMQAVSATAPSEANAMHIDMLESEFKSQLQRDFQVFPAAIGVNNHMGSLLTRHPGHMRWLMESLAEHGNKYFVDSRTTDKTVAATIAAEMAIPHTSRNVFLDNRPGDEALVESQLKRLTRLAHQEGFALAIGHPHPVTLRVLQRRLPELKAAGYQLVPVSQYIKRQEETKLWRVSSSRSPGVVKN